MTTRIPREGANSTDHTADERAIRDLFRRLLDDWARGDGNAYGSRFTENADYVAYNGSQCHRCFTPAALRQVSPGLAPYGPDRELQIPRSGHRPRLRNRKHRNARKDQALAGTGFDPDPGRCQIRTGVALRRVPQLEDTSHKRRGRG